MPNKVCPSCKAETHVRTSNCKCGYSFYIPVRKTKEESVSKPIDLPKIETKKVVTPPVSFKHVKDPVQVLIHEAEALGYTLKDSNPKSKELNKRFLIYKIIGHQKYQACFNKLGHITGAIQSN